VVGRRPDGYHELESLFLPLDLADEVELSVSRAQGARVELQLIDGSGEVPGGAENLAAQAASRFLSVAGLERRVAIRLRKRIPAAAGMGGGSSDAAAVLLGLSRLLPGAVDAAEMPELALSLGADVPFFLDPRPAIVRGVGELCEPLSPPWPARILLLANPGRPLPTAEVFGAYDRGPGATASGSQPRFVERVRAAGSDVGALPALLENQLEPAALSLCPAIAPLRDDLQNAGALAVGLSGSGATVFGVFPDEPGARAALPHFQPPVWAWVARTAEAR
jgi:4-diphosphocytidyl-2-C-methyl-D-erythritol kinase